MTKEFDKRNAAKSRKVCEAMAEAASTGKRVLIERERRILDMWPRFEDGKPVMFGDRFIDHRVNERTVRSVIVNNDGVELRTFDGTFDWHETGERVKRPAPKVLDADGVEIRAGDTVWFRSFSTGNRMCRATVTGFGERNLDVRLATVEDEAGRTWNIDPKRITHIAPDSWERFVEDMQKSACAYFGYQHKGCDEGDGCPARGALDCSNRKMTDLIRRAKALAGVEVEA